MRKTTIAAAVTATTIVLAGTQATWAQSLPSDLEILARVLSGDGVGPGQWELLRLREIRSELDKYRRYGIDEKDAGKYEALFTEGLRLTGEVAQTSDQDADVAKGAFARSYGTVRSVHSSDIAWRYTGVEGEVSEASYVRVGENAGAGYFYIPGTDTRLRITGYVRGGASWIENTHQLGGGTVVTDGGGDGNENFAARFGDYIQRGGVSLDFRTSGDYGGASIGKLPVVGVYGGYEGAWGDADYSGDATVGYDGVTGVGYTYFEPAPSTGAIAGSPGFGVEAQGHLENSWNRANFGLKVALPIGDDNTRVRGRLGVFYEDLKTSASGDTQLTYNGSAYAGYSQQWDLDAKDRYYGIRTGVHVGFKPQLDGKLKTSIGGDLYLGYHSGEGSYHQYSQAGGAPIMQMTDYSKNGLSVGGALTASVTYEFAQGWKLGGEAEFSCLPSVTSFFAPQNPNEQADAGFSSEHATRFFVRARLSHSF
ncbi:MAG: hypothetical protein CL534_15180 [Ahrensia sp.]|nr:hypothetical protein [Ahrensia sp.]